MERPEHGALRRAFEALTPIPEAEWAHASREAVLQDLPRGAALLCQGEPVEWLGYLARGLIRIHRLAGEHEVTLGFDCEGRFIGAYDAYATRTRARYGLQALVRSLRARCRCRVVSRRRAGTSGSRPGSRGAKPRSGLAPSRRAPHHELAEDPRTGPRDREGNRSTATRQAHRARLAVLSRAGSLAMLRTCKATLRLP